VSWDLLVRRARAATQARGAPAVEAEPFALAAAGGRIAWLGPDRALPAGAAAARELDAEGRLLTPGLVDCHTHLVHAGSRAAEWEARLAGRTYEELAAAGGGILSTVRATRAAAAGPGGVDALARASRPRLDALLASGVTTVEVKSGYGLDRETELAQLAAARRLGELLPVSVRTTFLGAHALPQEFAGRSGAYLEAVASWLPAARAAGADAVDAYCERGAFGPAELAPLLAAAGREGLGVKLHAGQFSDLGAAELAAAHRALSADHLEHVSERGIAALAAAGAVAVLLPGASFTLRDPARPPVAALRAAGVPLAVATDCNPGTSPLASLTAALCLACTLYGLAPAEALAGATREAARALGLADRGVLAPGLRADLALWDAEGPAELCQGLGPAPLAARILEGRVLRA
jgi:imidazolonepropionase